MPEKDLQDHYLAVSFTEPMRIMGVEIKVFIVNLAIAFFVVVFLKIYVWLAVAAILNFILKAATTDEPDIYAKYQVQGDFYEAFSCLKAKTNLRPNGFGRKTITD